MSSKRPMISMEMVLYLAEEKELKKKYAEAMADMRDGVLTSLLLDIADVFKVRLETIQSGDKQDLTVFVRSIFYHIARAKTHYGVIQMAKVAGRLNHTACVHHAKKVKRYFKDGDLEFLAMWHYYLTHSKLFTLKDFQ